MRHYGRFEPIRRANSHESTDIANATRDMMYQMSVMIGVPVPSMHEHLTESRKLQQKVSFHVALVANILKSRSSRACLLHPARQMDLRMSLTNEHKQGFLQHLDDDSSKTRMLEHMVQQQADTITLLRTLLAGL